MTFFSARRGAALGHWLRIGRSISGLRKVSYRIPDIRWFSSGLPSLGIHGYARGCQERGYGDHNANANTQLHVGLLTTDSQGLSGGFWSPTYLLPPTTNSRP